MTHTLITFLGRTEGGRREYPVAHYEFPDGTVDAVAFLGFSLRRWLEADRLAVLGTEGSMWDHLFEGDIKVEGGEEERLALLEEADAETVTQAHLDRVAPMLGRHLGCEVVLRLIPSAFDSEEQFAVLHTIAEVTADVRGADDRLSIDVTHGFRHLPMLGLMAALYLKGISRVTLAGLWYGVYNPDTRESRVVDMAGLLTIAEWLSALQRHEWLGDYVGVAKLLDDSELVERLRAISFKQSVHQGQQARGDVKKVRERLRRAPLKGPGALFQPKLEESMAWEEKGTLDRRQREQALQALDRGDFMRAALYAFEAYLTRLMRREDTKLDPNNRDQRQQAKENFEAELGRQPRSVIKAYRNLRGLRNVLAHGNRVGADLGDELEVLNSPDAMATLLRNSIHTLLPDE